MKTVYAFDPMTTAYTGPVQAQPSPLEPGKYLEDIPNTLKDAPPETGANEIACAVDGAWVIKADYRGQSFYKPDGSPVEIIEIGVTPDSDWTIQPPPPTIEQIAQGFEASVQGYLDSEAQAKGYDNITTACSYAGAPNPFQTEAQSFVTWRGNVWAYCYQALDDVKTGKRTIPTIEQIISELPVRA